VWGGDPGFRQTWLYYTSYMDFWKLSVPDLDRFLTMLWQNTILFLLMPVSLFRTELLLRIVYPSRSNSIRHKAGDLPPASL